MVKLSGESLKGDSNLGIDYESLNFLANEFKEATELGVQIAVVIGALTAISIGATAVIELICENKLNNKN